MVALGVLPELVSKVPLPSRSHSYLAMVPSGSLEAEPSKLTCCPVCAGLGVLWKAGTGAWLLPPKCWEIVLAGRARL